MTVRALRLPLLLAADALAGFAAAAFAVLVLGHAGEGPSLAGVAAAVVLSAALGSGLRALDIDEAQMRRLAVAASVPLLYLIAHTEYAPGAWPWDIGWLRDAVTERTSVIRGHRDATIGSAALVALWVRGLGRGLQAVDTTAVRSSSLAGLVAMALATATAAPAHGPEAWGAVALAYVVLALLALAAYQAPGSERSFAAYARSWAPVLVALPAGALALTSVASAIDPDAFGALAVLGVPLRLLGYGIGYALAPFVLLVSWLFGLIGVHELDLPRPQRFEPPRREAGEDDGSRPLWLQALGWLLAGGGLALAFGVAMLAVWLAVRRFARLAERDDEVREQVERETTLLDDVRALFAGARLHATLRRARTEVAIRRLYADVLDRAAADGLPRPPSVTPLQFEPWLRARYGEPAPAAITRAYVDARYGGRLPLDDEVRALVRAWRTQLDERPSERRGDGDA